MHKIALIKIDGSEAIVENNRKIDTYKNLGMGKF